MALPVVSGRVEYNGVRFSALTKTTISGSPEPGPDGRSTAYIRWTVNVEGYVTAAYDDANADDTNDIMTDWRKRLTAPAGKLTVEGRGFGNLRVNELGVYDVNYGPKPKLLSWTPIGDKRTCFVRWSCEVHLPEGATVNYVGRVMSCAYTTAFDIDQDGYTTVVRSGSITVPATRRGPNDPNPGDSADNYRQQITATARPITGFQRTQNYTLSTDKRTLNFTITDKELPYSYPTGVSTCDVTHSVSSNLKPHGFKIWTGRISATIVMANDDSYPDGIAWFKFLIIVARMLPVRDGALCGKTKSGATLIVSSVEISRKSVGREASFNLSYMVLGSSLKAIINDVGMFKTVGDGFQAWQASMSKSAQNDRGYAKLRASTNDDAIIELTNGAGLKIAVSVAPDNENAEKEGQVGTANLIQANASWLVWNCEIMMDEDTKRAFHKVMGAAAIQYKAGPVPMSAWQEMAKFVGENGVAVENKTATKNVIQQVGSPVVRIWLTGKAVRLSYDITPPSIQNAGGVVFSTGRRFVRKWTPTSLGEVPVNACEWAIEYLLATVPQSPIQTPSNPMVQQNGGAGQ